MTRAAASAMLSSATRRLLGLALGFLVCAPALAQSPARTSPVRFSGTTRLYAEASSGQRFGQQAPRGFVRWSVSPTVTVYNLPFSVDLLYTTEARGIQTDMTRLRGSLNLGAEQLQQMIRARLEARLERLAEQLAAEAVAELSGDSTLADVDSLRARADSVRTRVEEVRARYTQLRAQFDRYQRLLQNLQALPGKVDEYRRAGVLSALEGRALRFPSLGLGTVAPQYGLYTLDGVSSMGGNVEFTPGIVYVAAVGGRVRNPLQGGLGGVSPTFFSPYQRTLGAGRVGLGRPDGSHFHVVGMLVNDATRDTTSVTDTLQTYYTPQRNVVVGLSTGVAAFRRQLVLGGEVYAAAFTRDRKAAALDSTATADVPAFLLDLAEANTSSSGDLAGRAHLTFANTRGTSRVELSGEYLGPGYTSLGAPSIVNDRMTFGGVLDQTLFDRLSLGLHGRQERDNLADTKSGTTTSNRFGGSLALRTAPGWPSLRLGVIATSRTLSLATGIPATTFAGTSSTTRNVTAQSSLTRRGRGWSSTTFASVNLNAIRAGDARFGTSMFTANEVLTVRGVTANLSYLLIGRSGDFKADPQHRVSGTVGTTLLRRLRLDVGGTYDRSPDLGNTTGLVGTLSAPVPMLGELDVRLEQNWFGAGVYAPTKSQQTFFSLSLVRTW